MSQEWEDVMGSLRALQAPDEVVIRDVEGAEHRLRTTLPARRQLQVLRTLVDLLDVGRRLTLEGEASGTTTVMAAMAQLLLDDEVVARLGRAFEQAWGGDEDPLEKFPLEEIVAALLPLCTRFIRRSSSALL